MIGYGIDLEFLKCYTDSMNITSSKSTIKTIKQGDPNFIITDGFFQSHRASINISQNCPEKYKDIIVECLRKGWVGPIAHITEREMIISGLLK